jgi:hypothetical protein
MPRQIISCHTSLSYRYLKILGLNISEKMPRPATINKSAGCQWFILNSKPRLLNENDNAPVINANFFMLLFFKVSGFRLFVAVITESSK